MNKILCVYLSLFLFFSSAVLAVSNEFVVLSKKLFAEARQEMVKGEFDKAQYLLTQSLLANPVSAESFIYKGHVASLQKDFFESRRFIDLGLKIDPTHLQAIQWAGETAIALKDFDDAQKRLKRLEKLCSSCTEYKILSNFIQSTIQHEK